MSANKNNFKNLEGGIALPVSLDGEFLTDLISYEQGAYCEVYFEFYSDEKLSVPVNPTAGTITVTASPMGNVFLEPSAGSVIDAILVSAPLGTYTPPIIDGLVRKAKISVSGITGAAYMKAVLFNHI